MDQTAEVQKNKVCKHCKLSLCLTQFNKSSRRIDGLNSVCRKCYNHYQNSYRANNKDKVKAWDRQANIRSYGIEPGDYELMLAKQRGVCAICKTEDPGPRSNHFHIDHDHATGKVRGLLCNNCNRGIGLLKDSPSVLLQAHLYLTTQ